MRVQYTIYIENDVFADPQLYPDGIAYRSGIMDENGVEIDSEGDLPDYAQARELALSTLSRFTEKEPV